MHDEGTVWRIKQHCKWHIHSARELGEGTLACLGIGMWGVFQGKELAFELNPSEGHGWDKVPQLQARRGFEKPLYTLKEAFSHF